MEPQSPIDPQANKPVDAPEGGQQAPTSGTPVAPPPAEGGVAVPGAGADMPSMSPEPSEGVTPPVTPPTSPMPTAPPAAGQPAAPPTPGGVGAADASTPPAGGAPSGQQPPTPPKKPRSSTTPIIVLAIAVVVLLIVVAVYAFTTKK